MLKSLPHIVWPILESQFAHSPVPFFCTYTVTWRCNAKCMMCDVWKKTHSGELNQEQALSTLKKIPMMRVIRLTGGEPFIRHDLPNIVNNLVKDTAVQIVHVTTNGILTDAIVDFAKQAKPKNIHIKISLNSYKDHHDNIMGIPGAYNKVIKTIEALKEVQKNKSFLLGINQTITDWESYEASKKVRELCAHYDLPHLPVIAYKPVAFYDKQAGQINDSVDYMPLYDFSDQQLQEMLNDFSCETYKIKDVIERFVKRYYLEGLKNRLIKHEHNPHPRCVALRNHIRILPNGDIPVCLYNAKTVGNLYRDDLATIWNDAPAKASRQWVDACKGCWAECETIPSAVFSTKTIKEFLLSAMRISKR